jgi:[FeFe] hydrogenase H-cluster maturation GTPase HydF
MGLNDTPSAERVHIGFFGRRNAGKSSVVNAVTDQDLAVVSDTKGTTTDPVQKAMELLPLGPVVIIDTPGFDDEGNLGELRVRRTKRVLNKTDVAVLVVDAEVGMSECDRELVSIFKEKGIPYCIAYNKADLTGEKSAGENEIYVSALNGTNIWALKEMIARLVKTEDTKLKLVGDLLKPLDTAVLVVPVDSAAPKGRLILPQQQTIRDILEAGGISVVVRDSELKDALNSLGRDPELVITDSQVFEKVAAVTPQHIKLTSFSILMARYKGFLDIAVRGVTGIERLKDGDTVLIAEGCTHHRQCEDIGTVKIPTWLRKHTGRKLVFKTVSGGEFPEDLSPYSLIVHCGGCMLPKREMAYRMKCAQDQDVPITNYGVAIAYMKGILKRSLEVFPNLAKILIRQ